MKRLLLGLLLASCTPLKTAPNDVGHQMELTLHEVRTHLDDLRHDMNCFQTELQILEGRLKNQEQIAKPSDSGKLEQLERRLALLEKEGRGNLADLAEHSNELTLALKQCKERIEELEGRLFQMGTKAETTRNYKVKAGDSLEKIGRLHKISVDKIKKLNHLENDRIVPGQELKIPDPP
jgi:LysM repeat protein